jgi:hypothetical protein
MLWLIILLIVLFIVLFIVLISYLITKKCKKEYYINNNLDFIEKFVKEKNINVFVVHGLKNSGHTHRYIHDAINRTFLYLQKYLKNKGNNIEVKWIDDENIYNDKDNYLVFSSPHYNTDTNLPVQNNIYYILHYNKENYVTKKEIIKYNDLLKNKKAVKYVEFRFIPEKNMNINFLNESKTQWIDNNDNSLHLPWATNIFPEDIDKNINKVSKKCFDKNNGFLFCGTIWEKNYQIMNKTKNICEKLGLKYRVENIKDEDEHVKKIRETYIAPSIQGEGHCKSETEFYIPCRIFKNISYGALPITNNKGVANIFKDYLIIYDKDIEKLLKKSMEYLDKTDYNNYYKDLKKVMIFVRDNHTYINRIKTIIQFGFK